MNSFKKIALAVVAAMTLGTMAVAPANAAPMTVALTVNNQAPATAGTSVATAVALPVPSDNKIDATDALKIVATVDTGTAVSVEATNAVVVAALHDVAAPVTASSGSTSLTTATGTGTTATFFIYTKTTAVGTVVVRNQGTTLTYYVQGTAGKINTLTVSAPANGAAGTKQTIAVTATDVFGNKVSGKSITGRVFGSGGTLDSATATTGSGLADFGVAEFKLTLPTTATRSLVEFSLTTANDGETADVAGLTARTLAPYAEVSVRDLAAELAAEKVAKDAALAAKAAADKALADALAKATADAVAAKTAADAEKAAAVKVETDKAAAAAKIAADALAAKDAEIAKLKADNAAALAAIKKAFNDLAKKWNKKNPKAKVTLVK